MTLRPVASQSAEAIVILMYCNATSAPLFSCCVLCRWAWSSTEEDLHQMGKLALRPGDLSHWWLVYWPARWPHANPPSGSALRRTAGQYHTGTTLFCPNPDPGPQHDTHPAPQVRRKIHFFFLIFVFCGLLLLLLLVFLFFNSCHPFLFICVVITLVQ